MSLVRIYGKSVINLTKIISVEQTNNILRFYMPLSNYFMGGFLWQSDSLTVRVKFNSIEESTSELLSIQKSLDDYLQKK